MSDPRSYPDISGLRQALDAIQAQCDDMRSLKGWWLNLLRENLAKAYAALSEAERLNDRLGIAQRIIAEYKASTTAGAKAEIASEAQGAVAPWLWACTGCGSQMTMDQIKGEHPNALCCCPERRMAPLPSTKSGGAA